MVEASDQILRHIEAQRSQLSGHVAELEDRVKTTVRRSVDWRVQMDKHPVAFIAAGFVAAAVVLNLLRKH